MKKELEDLDTETLEKLSAILKTKDSLLKTKGHKKLINYFRETSDKEVIQTKIKSFRKKYGIPLNGFILNPDDYKEIPESWWHKTGKFIKSYELNKDVCDILKIYRLSKDWVLFLTAYLFYNKLVIDGAENRYNLLQAVDISSNKNKIAGIDPAFYPVAVCISTYASKRDILDFIGRTYNPLISSLQTEYKSKEVKIGKFRTKKPEIQARNKFIYNHRHLPFKEIVSMVSSEFPGKITNTIDEGSVGKIISLEKKRRKEV